MQKKNVRKTPSSAAVFCSDCGFKNQKSAVFCGNCGARLRYGAYAAAARSRGLITSNEFIWVWLAGTALWTIFGYFFGVIYTAIAALILTVVLYNYITSATNVKIFLLAASAFSLVGIIIAAYVLNRKGKVYPGLSILAQIGLFFLAILVAVAVGIVLVAAFY